MMTIKEKVGILFDHECLKFKLEKATKARDLADSKYSAANRSYFAMTGINLDPQVWGDTRTIIEDLKAKEMKAKEELIMAQEKLLEAQEALNTFRNTHFGG